MLIENHKIDVRCAPEEHNKDNRKNRSDFFKIVFSNSIPLRPACRQTGSAACPPWRVFAR
jgi:hypothetical protein